MPAKAGEKGPAKAGEVADAPAQPSTDAPPAIPAEPTPPIVVQPPQPEPRGLQLRRAIAKARIAVLSLPLEKRQALVDAEAEKRRLERVEEQARVDREEADTEAREAEAARQRALAAVEAARTALGRELAILRASAETVRRDQAELRQQLVAKRQAFDKSQAAGSSTHPLIEAVDNVARRTDEAAALFEPVTEEVDAARAELRSALHDAERRPPVPRLKIVLPPVPVDDAENRAIYDEIVELRGRIAQSADELVQMDALLARDTVHEAFSREESLTVASIALLDKLPTAKRREVLGFGPEGRAQLRRELSHVPLAIRWYRIERQQLLPRALETARQPFEALRLAGGLFWFFTTIITAIWLARRRVSFLKRARAAAMRSARSPAGIRTWRLVFDALKWLAGPSILLLAVMIGWRALHRFHGIDELDLFATLAWDYAVYRFAIVSLHGLITRASRARALQFASQYSDKVLRSLQLVGLTALIIVMLLHVSGHVLGHGYLYLLVLGFSWICVFPIALVLIRRWRGDIVDAYLAYRPEGHLAKAVAATRDRWYGFFVAVVAVAYLAIRALVLLIQSFLLGFEQSRKALAFLFRRRLERRAEAQAVEDEVTLPEPLVRALTTEPAAPEVLIDNYPGIEQFDAALAEWRRDERLGSLLVVTEPGYGKTEWMRAACARAEGVPVTWLTLQGHSYRPEQLLSQIGEALSAPASERASARTLARWLLEQGGERRLVVVDNLELIILRGVDTLRAWDEFRELMKLARGRVFWLGAMDQDPFEFLVWARGRDEGFRHVVERAHWSEEEITKLLQHRTQAAGFEPVYHDLVVNRVEGVSAETQMVSTGREYARLIWDYSDGCPRLALHCWRLSLQPDTENRVRVRLFRRPDTKCLDQLSERNRFILASVVWHANLTLNEAVESLRFSPAACEDGLEHLRERGVLRLEDEHYVVATPWLRHVNRYLRRHHLIRD